MVVTSVWWSPLFAACVAGAPEKILQLSTAYLNKYGEVGWLVGWLLGRCIHSPLPFRRFL